jgi:hypothetical protein
MYGQSWETLKVRLPITDEGSMESVSAVRNLDISNQVSVQVAKKALDVQKDQGRAMIDLLRDAAKVGGSQTGRLDLYA